MRAASFDIADAIDCVFPFAMPDDKGIVVAVVVADGEPTAVGIVVDGMVEVLELELGVNAAIPVGTVELVDVEAGTAVDEGVATVVDVVLVVDATVGVVVDVVIVVVVVVVVEGIGSVSAPATATGVERLTADESPSCPELFNPQHLIEAVNNTAQV